MPTHLEVQYKALLSHTVLLQLVDKGMSRIFPWSNFAYTFGRFTNRGLDPGLNPFDPQSLTTTEEPNDSCLRKSFRRRS